MGHNLDDIISRSKPSAENPCGFSREKLAIGERLSYSRLKELSRSPGHFKLRYIDGVEDEPTPDMEFGTAAHMAILDPERFGREYVAKPDRSTYPATYDTADELRGFCRELGLKTTGTKQELVDRIIEHDPHLGDRLWPEIMARFERAAGSRKVISALNALKIQAMTKVVALHPSASKLLQDGRPELFAYWRDPEFDVVWSCALDYIRVKNGIAWITELKTTRDASTLAFRSEIGRFQYHIQNWIYRRVVEGITGLKTQVIQLAVEKTPPFGVAMYAHDARAHETAGAQVRGLIEKYKACKASDLWPVYPDEVQTIGLPNWKYWEIEEQYNMENPSP